MNNFRMWAYAMIASGLINWDYQRANQHIAVKSLAIVIPGLLLLLFTFTPKTQELLKNRNIQILWGIIGAAALIYAFVN